LEILQRLRKEDILTDSPSDFASQVKAAFSTLSVMTGLNINTRDLSTLDPIQLEGNITFIVALKPMVPLGSSMEPTSSNFFETIPFQLFEILHHNRYSHFAWKEYRNRLNDLTEAMSRATLAHSKSPNTKTLGGIDTDMVQLQTTLKQQKEKWSAISWTNSHLTAIRKAFKGQLLSDDQ